MSARIVFIGAGSVEFTKNLLGDILSFPELADAEIALHDIDEERLEAGEAIARWTNGAVGASATISSHLDRRAALEGADYVVNMVQVGGHEATVLGTMVDRRLSKGFESIGRRHLRSHVPDPELRSRLTPTYTLGCKRITLSNRYYPALCQPNVELVTDPIREVRPHSIVTDDDTTRELDTIILGTGFKVHDNPGFSRVRGRGGRSLGDAWQGSPRAYLGTTIPGFPNLFLLVGPNSAGGYNSIVFTTEAHVNYVIACLREMDRRRLQAVEVRRHVYDEFNRLADERLRGSVWNRGGCTSWYLDSNGRNGVWWPGFTWRLWQRTRRFDPREYRLRAV